MSDHLVSFSLEHCWRELRNEQKWRSHSLKKASGKDKRKESVPDVVPDGEPEVEEVRPPGVKAAKAAKRKKSGGLPGSEAYDRLEFIGNQKILQKLLAKKEPLTEMEVALSQKIMSEMLK